jgi:hypothetical protein
MNVPHPTEGAILEYSRRLKKLHEFIREGEGDSDEADALRDEMDDSYFQLTPEEIEGLESLSADLHVLGEDRPLSGDRPADGAMRRQMLDAARGDDWGKLRSLLDSDADSSELFDRILFRAIYWAALKDYESSLEFLEFLARRVEEDRSRFEIMQSELDRFARVGKSIKEIAVVQGLGRNALGRLAQVGEEIHRLIVDLRSMRSSTIPAVSDLVSWDLVKGRFFQAEEHARALFELAA